MKRMNVAIVCFGIIICLLMASFSPVIGIQSIRDNNKMDSPLFEFRTLRAINSEQKSLTSNYIGMGERINLSFANRNNKDMQIPDLISKIQAMDTSVFNKFIGYVMNWMYQNEKMENVPSEMILVLLRQIRTDSKNFWLNVDDTTGNRLTWEYCPTICWFPGCVLLYLLESFIGFIGFFIFLYVTMMGHETVCGTCVSHCIT